MRALILLLTVASCSPVTATVMPQGPLTTDPDPDPDSDTDPSKRDLDGDGWASDEDCDDGDPEVFPGAEERCDPVDHNCDGDVIDDAVCPCDLVIYGTDPEVFFVMCEERLRWPQAAETCDESEMQLLVLEDEAEAGLVRQFVQQTGLGELWLGLSDREREGEFVWVDGSPLSWHDFGPGEPNDWGRGEDCVVMFGWNGNWNDADCRDFKPFACEPR